MRKSLRPDRLFEADAGGGTGGVGQDPAGSGAQAGSGDDRAAQLERELTELRSKLTAREQAEAEAQRKAAEEAGNFKKLYEDAQTQLKAAQDAQAAQAAKQQRLAAASAAGLDAELADRLVGDTPEALAADAKKLAARLAPVAPSTGATNPGAARGAKTLEDRTNEAWAKRGKRGGLRFQG